MNKFFDFSASQIKVISILAILLLVLSIWKFLKGYSQIDERSLKFTVQLGDNDTRYKTPFIIDLNRSPIDSLELLPGIGPVMAGRIAAYRDSCRFEAPRDIIKVKGIGSDKFEKLKDYIKVGEW